jgi:hypothetical protein
MELNIALFTILASGFVMLVWLDGYNHGGRK